MNTIKLLISLFIIAYIIWDDKRKEKRSKQRPINN
jgi:hypothetical protein